MQCQPSFYFGYVCVYCVYIEWWVCVCVPDCVYCTCVYTYVCVFVCVCMCVCVCVLSMGLCVF